MPSIAQARTIRFERRPTRPTIVAIATSVVIAVMVLVVAWAQISFSGGHTPATVPSNVPGRTSAARRKDTDEGDARDPMSVGGASEELAAQTRQWWIEAATKAGIDLTGFDPHSPLAERIAWALQAGLEIAVVLSRFSTKLQHSTAAQIQHTIEYAGQHRMYVPPEFLCVDEAEKGRRLRRDGLERARAILRSGRVQTLLVFKVSRLLRTAYKSFEFVNEEIVEEGLRAISTSQGIDTRDEKTWKALMYMHGMLDDMLLDTIADHCRAGLKTLFEQGYVTGAVAVGYGRVEVPGAPLTNRKLPRTMPKVVSEVAALIKQHYEWIRDGMTIKEGWRRWLAAGGPCDPRSVNKLMSYQAYRRMLSNPRYLGCWAFGRKRNRWSTKRDYTQQVDTAETEVAIYQCPELRIVDDVLFYAVQSRLAEFKLGPRGPHKQKKQVHLWDLVTECFFCDHCKVRFHQGGAMGKGMRCKRGDLCPCCSAVNRKEAVEAVCRKFIERIRRDADFFRRILCSGQKIDAQGDSHLQSEIASTRAKIQALTNKINDLEEVMGQGSDDDHRRRKSVVSVASVDRAKLQTDLAGLESRVEGAKAITPETITEILDDFVTLLDNAASGQLGSDVVYKAAGIFKRLTGGRIWVRVEKRPGRKRTNVRGIFTPPLLRVVADEAASREVSDTRAPEQVEVWLRKPPRLDAIAERVHQLIDFDGNAYREAAKALQDEGHKVNSGNVWYSYRRWYEMNGLPVPERPYNNGRPRKSR